VLYFMDPLGPFIIRDEISSKNCTNLHSLGSESVAFQVEQQNNCTRKDKKSSRNLVISR
jgi:hypothetical protein